MKTYSGRCSLRWLRAWLGKTGPGDRLRHTGKLSTTVIRRKRERSQTREGVPMDTCKFLTACVFVGVVGTVALGQQGEKVAILDTIQGTVANDKKPELKTGFVATEAEWKAAWGKISPKEKLPEVDFAKHLLLV